MHRPPFTLAVVQKMSPAPLAWVWQCDMLAAFIYYGKAEGVEAPKAGRILAHSMWQVLYRSAEVPQPGYATKRKRPVE